MSDLDWLAVNAGDLSAVHSVFKCVGRRGDKPFFCQKADGLRETYSIASVKARREEMIKRPESVIDPVVVANVEEFNSVGFAMNLIGADKMKEWNGEGLPPVGTVCNVDTDFHRVEAEIKLYDGDSVVYRPKVGSLYSELIVDCEFTPIRTEEDKAVDELVNIIELNSHSIKDTARAIIKAGYKK